MSQPFELIGKFSTLLTLSLKGICLLELAQVNNILNALLTGVTVVYISIKIWKLINQGKSISKKVK